MARPTKFDPKYTEKLLKYFDVEPYRQSIAETSKEFFKEGTIKKESTKYRLIANKMPTLYGFSKLVKVNYTTIWRWADKGDDETIEKMINAQMKAGKTDKKALEIAKGIKEFCNAYKEAKEMQKEFLVNLGLSGAAPSTFTIFTAKNVTDMRDKSETDITSGGVPLINADEYIRKVYGESGEDSE